MGEPQQQGCTVGKQTPMEEVIRRNAGSRQIIEHLSGKWAERTKRDAHPWPRQGTFDISILNLMEEKVNNYKCIDKGEKRTQKKNIELEVLYEFRKIAREKEFEEDETKATAPEMPEKMAEPEPERRELERPPPYAKRESMYPVIYSGDPESDEEDLTPRLKLGALQITGNEKDLVKMAMEIGATHLANQETRERRPNTNSQQQAEPAMRERRPNTNSQQQAEPAMRERRPNTNPFLQQTEPAELEVMTAGPSALPPAQMEELLEGARRYQEDSQLSPIQEEREEPEVGELVDLSLGPYQGQDQNRQRTTAERGPPSGDVRLVPEPRRTPEVQAVRRMGNGKEELPKAPKSRGQEILQGPDEYRQAMINHHPVEEYRRATAPLRLEGERKPSGTEGPRLPPSGLRLAPRSSIVYGSNLDWDWWQDDNERRRKEQERILREREEREYASAGKIGVVMSTEGAIGKIEKRITDINDALNRLGESMISEQGRQEQKQRWCENRISETQEIREENAKIIENQEKIVEELEKNYRIRNRNESDRKKAQADIERLGREQERIIDIQRQMQTDAKIAQLREKQLKTTLQEVKGELEEACESMRQMEKDTRKQTGEAVSLLREGREALQQGIQMHQNLSRLREERGILQHGIQMQQSRLHDSSRLHRDTVQEKSNEALGQERWEKGDPRHSTTVGEDPEEEDEDVETFSEGDIPYGGSPVPSDMEEELLQDLRENEEADWGNEWGSRCNGCERIFRNYRGMKAHQGKPGSECKGKDGVRVKIKFDKDGKVTVCPVMIPPALMATGLKGISRVKKGVEKGLNEMRRGMQKGLSEIESGMKKSLNETQKGLRKEKKERSRRMKEADSDEDTPVMAPLLIKSGVAHYQPWSHTDVEGLVQRLPILQEGAGIWITKFEDETVGKTLALGDIKYVLSRILGKAEAGSVLDKEGIGKIMEDPAVDGVLFDTARTQVWKALRAAYPNQYSPGIISIDKLKEDENPVAFVEKAAKLWKARMEQDPDANNAIRAQFRQAVMSALPKPVRTLLEGEWRLGVMSKDEFRQAVSHFVNKYRQDKEDRDQQNVEAQRKLVQMQIQETKNNSKKTAIQAAVMQPTAGPQQPPMEVTQQPPQGQSQRNQDGYEQGGQQRQRGNRPKGQGQGQRNNQQGPIKCFRCGGQGHIARACGTPNNQQYGSQGQQQHQQPPQQMMQAPPVMAYGQPAGCGYQSPPQQGGGYHQQQALPVQMMGPQGGGQIPNQPMNQVPMQMQQAAAPANVQGPVSPYGGAPY